MTAAEQIFHSNTLKSSAASSTGNMDSSSFTSPSVRLNVADVSSQFNLEYYNTMSRQPDHLHGFYGKQSQMVHSVEGDLEAPVCVTLETIHARILTMGYQGARIIVESIDAQASLNGGIFILTTGNMKLKTGIVKKFVQSFFLAEQPNGYYVLNDCFRFIESSSSVPSAVATPVIKEAPVQNPVHQAAAKVEPKPATPVKEKPSVPVQAPVVEAVKERKPEPVREAPVDKTAPAATVSKPQAAPVKKPAPEPKNTAPSSWASLAAGGSDLWKDGVVAPTKAPVVTAAAPAAPVNPSKETGRREQGGAPRTFSSRNASGNRPDRDNRSPRQPQQQESSSRPMQDFSRSVFIRNLGSNPDSAALRKVLETVGVITSFDFNGFKGQAFVEFESAVMATNAIKGKFELNGVVLSIDARRPASQRPNGSAGRSRPSGGEQKE